MSKNILCPSEEFFKKSGAILTLSILNKNLINANDNINRISTNISTLQPNEVYVNPYLIIDDTDLIIEIADNGKRCALFHQSLLKKAYLVMN